MESSVGLLFTRWLSWERWHMGEPWSPLSEPKSEVMEAWMGVGGGHGTRQRRQRSRPQALWAPHSAVLLSGSSAPLALSRLMFFPVDDTSVWQVPPQFFRGHSFSSPCLDITPREGPL